MRKNNQAKLPVHIAIIMDGNGRWAKKRGLTRLKGHYEGVNAIRKVIEAAKKYNIKYLTLYAFSTENWKRPKSEIQGLFNLMHKFLKNELPNLIKNDIKLRAIGDISKIPEKSRKTLLETIEKTKDCKSLEVIVALNYGSRQEITNAVNKLLNTGKKHITQEDIQNLLYTAGIPDPDLLIRTSGEKRISNFLLWQLSYTELYFTDVLWPDFSEKDFLNAIKEYQKRKRRFGGLE